MLLTGAAIFLIITVSAVAYHRIALKIWSSIFYIILIFYTILSLYLKNTSHFKLSIIWIISLLILLPLMILPLRRKLFSARLFKYYQKLLPQISDTEKASLGAGTVTWEAELFKGKPDFKKLLSIPVANLSEAEKAFINGPVDILCSKLNDWEITHVYADLPEEIWQFLKTEGFFGLIIPKQYGGKGFSAWAHSEILCKIYSVSVTVATTISVPNALGPAQLLLRYGTEAQKNYYLPRLARGEEIPCFALTSPEAGSDASSISDTGTICRDQFEGKEIIGIKLNWNKRYITLAPIATVLGLAFKLYDPQKLLSNQTDYGITCALIPTHLPGITIGRRHFPLNMAFLNGPTQGKEVFIPLEKIIGGIEMAGHGWRMLMECLSTGRAITLPSSAIGGAKMAFLTTSAYACIRRQFNLPISQFEGIAEVLSRMAAYIYLMEAARNLTISLIEQKEKPAVLSAIMKYHMTELSRKISCDAMDIQAGKGICLGPRNYIARFFQSMPIAITVEGANILTRSLIIFGQGVIQAHAYVKKEIQSIEKNDLVQFDRALWGHIGQIISNKVRTFFLGITQGYGVASPVLTLTTRRYYQLLTRFSSAFSLLTDCTLLVLGKNIKRRERISGRLGDILSYLYLISAMLKYYEHTEKSYEDLPLVQWACQQFFFEIQTQFAIILQNFPHRGWRLLLSFLIFPLGKRLKLPEDVLSQQIADKITTPSNMRIKLTKGVFKGNNIAKLEEALAKTFAILPLVKLKKENLKAEELEAIEAADKLCREIIAVDDFSSEELRH